MNEERLALIRARKAAGQARWEGIGPRTRSRQMKAVRAHGGGMPRSKGPRCWCGKYTLHSATQRQFDCCKRAGLWPGRPPKSVVRGSKGDKAPPREIEVKL